MPKVSFTPEDIKQRNQLPAGWYEIKLKQVNEETSKDGQSTNYVCQFVITKAKNPEDVGTPIRHWFNEKAMGRVQDYIMCFTGKIEAGKEYDLSDTVDRPVQAYIHYDAERKFNVIDDFKKAA